MMTQQQAKYHTGHQTWRETETAVPVFLEPTEPWTFGIDVSTYQGAIDFQQCEADGVKFAAIRCTVGDYYTDQRFLTNWEGFGQTNIVRMPYLVVTPAWYDDGSHPVNAGQHWQRFLDALDGIVPEIIVLDCELTRGMSAQYIANLINDLIWMCEDFTGRMPVIYTRGEWWNSNTVPMVAFGQCDLWIARYNEHIEHPWEDNDLFKPRDWDTWTFWQYSQEGVLPGIPDYNVDFDRFNGTLEDLLVWFDDPPPPPVEPPPDDTVDLIKEILDKLDDHERRIRRLELTDHIEEEGK